MLGDALCASGERIESRERSTDDAVDDAYYRDPKQEGGWSTISSELAEASRDAVTRAG
ncbi:hypothetical protein ALC56_05464 [Trachymyrmex septentrionalis]|uniref:Uncharacterized protein n=1 Tax=Trachymyrmex septentrionalis TaxID=34720 RepID=A0A195FKJ4_9HYME|nr:hypothetical protein ALC56_05464 [Trachymyrmex septentrionalis]